MRGVGVLGFFGSGGALYVAAGSALSMLFCICNERTQILHGYWIFARICICSGPYRTLLKCWLSFR